MPAGVRTFFADATVDLDTSVKTGRWIGEVVITSAGSSYIDVPRQSGELVFYYAHNLSNYRIDMVLVDASAPGVPDETGARISYDVTGSGSFTGSIVLSYGAY